MKLEKRELEQLESFDVSKLYKTLDQSFYQEGLGVIPDLENGDEERGRNRYLALLHKYRKEICKSEKIKSLYTDKKNVRRMEIASAIADLVISLISPIAAFTFGFIASKKLYDEICE